MLAPIVYLAPYVLGFVALVSLLGAIINFRGARKYRYFRLRRQISTRAWRWTLVFLLALGGVAASLRLRPLFAPFSLRAYFIPPPTPTATLPPTFETPRPSATPSPLPPTLTPSATPAPPTPTPYLATVQSTVTPPATASLTITAISSGISTNLTPVNAGTTFPAGTPRFYIWLAYSDMVDGLSWSRVLLINSEVVRSESELWEHGAVGTAYYWFEAQGGWPAGHYEVQIYIGERLVASQAFDVVD